MSAAIAAINEQNIVLINPITPSLKYENPEVSQPVDLDAQWQTPGLYITQKIAGIPLVRFIGEKIQADCLQTIIVVDDDPEDLIDKIFSIEQELYNKFINLRFDVRLRVISPEENIEVIKKSTLSYYDRQKY